MNIAQALKLIFKEAHTKRVDKEVEASLKVILEKFTEEEDWWNSDKPNRSIEFDICWKDAIDEEKYHSRPWDEDFLTDAQKILCRKQRIKELDILCKKLNKFGFKCETKCHKPSMVDYGYGKRLSLSNPWISVKI